MHSRKKRKSRWKCIFNLIWMQKKWKTQRRNGKQLAIYGINSHSLAIIYGCLWNWKRNAHSPSFWFGSFCAVNWRGRKAKNMELYAYGRSTSTNNAKIDLDAAGVTLRFGCNHDIYWKSNRNSFHLTFFAISCPHHFHRYSCLETGHCNQGFLTSYQCQNHVNTNGTIAFDILSKKRWKKLLIANFRVLWTLFRDKVMW